MIALFQRGGHVISVVLVLPHPYYRLSSVMLASQRWHTEDHFRLVASHRAMPSLCPLPSAVNTGGRSNLTALGGELEEEGLCCSFGHSGTWVEKQAPGSKASKLAFGRPRCKASTPSVFACQRVGVGWGIVGVGTESVRGPSLSHRK